MFGMGMTEVFLIMVVALVFIGPKKLPQLARTLARMLAELRNIGDELRRTFHEEVYKNKDSDGFSDSNPYAKINEDSSAELRDGPEGRLFDPDICEGGKGNSDGLADKEFDS